jgi:hypothetical protein
MKQVVVFSFLFTAVTCAVGQNASDMLKKTYIEAGINEFYYHYSEKFDAATLALTGVTNYRGEPKSDEYGMAPMFHAEGAAYADQMPLWASGFFEIGSGTHTYDGASQDSAEISGGDTVWVFLPLSVKKTNHFMNLGIFVGPYFSNGNFLIGLQAGIEYHSWKRYLQGMTEQYNWTYAPVKVHAAVQVSPTVGIGCNAAYRFTVSGSMKADFGIAGYMLDINAPELTLGTEQGLYVDVPIQVGFNRLIGVEIKP